MYIAKSLTLIAGLGLFALANCSHSEHSPQVAQASIPANVQEAVEQLSSAQCQYHQRCGDVGEHQKYSNREHCMTVMRDEARDQIGECRTGVDQGDLNDCLKRIHEQGCGGLKISLWKQCSSDNMCLH